MAIKFHFLVVDDFPVMRRIVMGQLRQLGYATMTEADNGAMALKSIKSHQDANPVKFVITDWNMPVMDGLTLLKTIRETAELKHLPVLMITAEAKKENLIAAAHAGADGYIVKPFAIDVLREKIDRILSRKGL